MIDELMNASNRLRAALDHYVRICSKVQDVCLQGLDSQNITSEYIEQVDRELGLIESYDVKMQLAKTAIKITRNYAFNTVPINRFPTEILGRIFQIARAIEPRCIDQVARVCSRWRTIALGNPSLWSRIDLHPSLCKSFYPSLNRAQTHVSRSGKLSLDVHISASPEPDNSTEGYHEKPMIDLCALAAPRMGSLEIDLHDFRLNDLLNSTYPAIASLFLHCTPGLFTEIATFCGHYGFFVSDREQTNAGMWAMRIPVEYSHIEAVLATVTVLKLTGLYPSWTSRAYHGLVELRLTGSFGGQDSIPEWQFINILKSSPGLRVLSTNINITTRIPENLDVSVSLPELETLHVDSEALQEGKSCHLELVRFLVPGPQPLDLTMQCASLPLSESSLAQTKAFLTRSNTTKLRLDSVCRPFALLPSTPHIKSLILSNCTSLLSDQLGPVEHSDQQSIDPVMYPHLDICVVVESSLSLDEFCSLVQSCRIRTLRIHDSRFYRDVDKQEVVAEDVMRELLKICSDAKITEDVPTAVRLGEVLF
ncbi:hypothetical protein RSOLAG1IB_07350 [Rhizoctonia solani AG-1 IB]|uniref:F-box domain-containing protein n=1 Tax=Thanatephorus cucumeris (strain AG1-IB / isolate 7/3/14) TaxID=1108050 RepID=A0A0B7FD54_THACB|nr:hypothetical protein RSOLAG1IB_07350 [Rhizoctonia solani AG-1 IB]